ncbi:MAG: thiopurine S-methyltransferase [Cyanobacteria bacterium P01_G01_bin.54]
MDLGFWRQRWESNHITFHKSEANTLLLNHFGQLALAQDSRVFVPLCGKTLDIAWLLSQGYRVVGAELIAMAIEQLFTELGVEPKISQLGDFSLYSAPNLDIFVGDIFNLSGERLGPVDAIYDRAALVALPEAMRQQYTRHLTEITQTAPQLLITFEYDQSLMAGPPFSISTAEVHQHYQSRYNLSLVSTTDVAGGLKGKCAATENVWLLQ